MADKNKPSENHEPKALVIHDVVVPKGTLCRCECEMPNIDGRQGLCGRCERPIIA